MVRGLYSLPNSEVGELHSLAEASKRVPRSVICLLSALRFHGLTTQNPFQVWIAIDVNARAPKQNGVPLRIVRSSGFALRSSVESHNVEGVQIRVYSAARTVADCFKFRNKIGLGVAIEALRDCRQQRKATMDEIWALAKVCRVTTVIRPYLESLVSGCLKTRHVAAIVIPSSARNLLYERGLRKADSSLCSERLRLRRSETAWCEE